MGKQKTAVEWFVEEMFKQGYLNDTPLTVKNIEHFVQQAKEMEKEQIIKAYMNVHSENEYRWVEDDLGKELALQYYNEIFKSE